MGRKILIIWAVLGISAMAHGTEYEIFVVAGQSNACGRARVGVGEMEEGSDAVSLWYEIDPGYGEGFPHSCSEGWRGLAPQERAGTGRRYIGPEMGLGRVLSRLGGAGKRVVIFKYARGGSALVKDWLACDGPQLYGGMIRAFYERALPALVGPEDSWRVAGFFWMQGESESTSREAAEVYGEDLKRFLERVREDFRNEGMAVVLGRISWRGGEGDEHVRGAQMGVAREDGLGIWVDTDDLARNSAVDAHFSVAGQLELGRRMGLAYLHCRRRGGMAGL